MYDYKIVEQVTRKKKRLSGVLKKTMVFFAVVFVVMGITISQAFNAHQFFFRFLGVAPNAPAHRHLFLRFLLQMADLFSVSAPHCTACAHYSLPVSGAVSAAGASAGCSAGVSSSSP